MKNFFTTLSLVVFALLFSAPAAFAQSWWGAGARSNAWVLAHGGSIIRYKIIASGAGDRYKAILYKNGKVVEWENGKNGLFDDPKDATYVVKAFKGGIDKSKTSKGGKKILSSDPITVRPGETVVVTLNDLTNEVSVVSDRKVAQVAKPLPKKEVTPAAPQETVPQVTTPVVVPEGNQNPEVVATDTNTSSDGVPVDCGTCQIPAEPAPPVSGLLVAPDNPFGF